MKKNVFIAGHRGMVGSAIIRQLETREEYNLITRSRDELDLKNQQEVIDFFNSNEIHEVYLAAAKVGGIHANNTYPAEFIYENLMIESNIIHQAYASGVKKLLFLGESYNRQYGVDFRSVMPTNLYGPNDNFHPENSHVVPALIRRFHEAKLNGDDKVVVWGSGTPMREFLHVDDMAAASIFVMNLSEQKYKANTQPMLSHINVGTGVDCTIRELAETVSKVVGFSGDICFDASKPDGTPRKLMNVDRLRQMGWSFSITLEQGIENSYQWFLDNSDMVRL